MAIERKVPGEIRIFLNHVYEFKKEYATWYSIR